jgi:restriction system protein
MSQNDTTMWGIHGGRAGDADSLFLRKQCIALGWARLGDLSKIPSDREAFKEQVAKAYPDAKTGALPVYAGQLFRFVHEIKLGDQVVYPSRRDHQVHLGQVAGPYAHDPTGEEAYPNRRPVKWLKTVPRTRFSQGALYGIGSAMALFQVKNYVDEFRSAIEGKVGDPPPVAQDETIVRVAEEIEETTRDFIIKRIAQELKGHPMAELVAHLLNAMGYRCRVSPPGTDEGIDIVAHRDELGFEPPIIKVQVKSTEGSIGDPVVSALYGKVDPEEYGLVVTLGSYTSQARAFARSKSNLRLIDGEEFVRLLLQHYENFDARYKGLLPLRRVYVPESLEEGED